MPDWLINIGLSHYLTVSFVLFGIGLLGVVTSRHVIRVLMSVELMLNAVNVALVAFNNTVNPNDLSGQVFSIFVLTISAAEAAVGLALVIALYRAKSSVDMTSFSILNG